MTMLVLIASAFRKPQPEWLAPWLFVVAAVVLLILYGAARRRRKRREGLAQFALENGFTLSERPDPAAAEELAQIHVGPAAFEGRARYSNAMRGSVGGLDTIIADRTVGSGKSSSTATIVAFKFSAPFPAFMLCGENVLWHIAEKLGFADVDIDGAPDFSRRFFLHGQDQAAIRALFKPEITQAFEQIDKHRPSYVSASGQWLVTYYPGRQIDPAKLREFLQQAQVLAEAFRRAQTAGVFR